MMDQWAVMKAAFKLEDASTMFVLAENKDAALEVACHLKFCGSMDIVMVAQRPEDWPLLAEKWLHRPLNHLEVTEALKEIDKTPQFRSEKVIDVLKNIDLRVAPTTEKH